MSLFNELQWEIIKNPKNTYSALKVRQEQKESEEEKEKRLKQEWKDLCKEKKQELSKEEYDKWRVKEWYQRNKEWYSEKQLNSYHKRKEEEEAMIEEIYKEVYDILPEPINWDEYYAKEFREDDINYEGKFKFSRWASRLNRVKPSKEKAYTNPVKVYNFANLWWVLSNLWRIQDRAYEYLRPHINEINLGDFKLSKKQSLTKNPVRNAWWNMRKLADATDISMNQLYSVASAMLRDKYIINEIYLGRASFLVGDVIISQAGNIYRPCLENNIPWLTPDTVEELHKKRFDWLKKKTDDLDIYVLRDTYLVKYQPNEREKMFYIIPT